MLVSLNQKTVTKAKLIIFVKLNFLLGRVISKTVDNLVPAIHDSL